MHELLGLLDLRGLPDLHELLGWFSDHDDGADPMEEELFDAPETAPDRDDDDGALDFQDDEDEK